MFNDISDHLPIFALCEYNISRYNVKEFQFIRNMNEAFDTVDHDILCKKLHFYGLRGVAQEWIQSYLENRKQFVSFNNCHSEILNVSCGVPQCSILGPTLFIMYINDICKVSQVFKYILFADDTNLLCCDRDLNELVRMINGGLEQL